VIVGYTEPRRSRKYFGSLVLAVCDNTTKRWVYAGHVGTGFDQSALKSLYGTMQPLRTRKKPFDQKVKDEHATTWLIPKLVGEVKFTEWTSEGEMRHPAFLGLRYPAETIEAMRQHLLGYRDNMRVEVETDIAVTAKTVADLRALATWPDGLVLNIHIDLDPRLSVVRVERAS